MSDYKYHLYYDNNPLSVGPPFSAGFRDFSQFDIRLGEK